MPPLPDLSVLARVRWGNVAIVVTVLAAGGLIVAWPSLRAQAPPLPPAAPRPVSAQRATTTRTTPPPQAWGSEFGVESAAPVAPTPTTPRAHPHPPKAHEPVHRHPAVRHKRHTARPDTAANANTRANPHAVAATATGPAAATDRAPAAAPERQQRIPADRVLRP